MTQQNRTWLKRFAWVGAIIAVLPIWQFFQNKRDNENIIVGKGHVEATEIDIIAGPAGRIKTILVQEGDFVANGQVVARMDTKMIEARHRQAEAQMRQTQSEVAIAHDRIAQRESEKVVAEAILLQRRTEFIAARKRLEQALALAANGKISLQQADVEWILVQGCEAAVNAALAQTMAADAAIMTARSQLIGARSSVAVAKAAVERIKAEVADNDLKAPCSGCVRYPTDRQLEVIEAGGRVLSLVDLSDVHVSFILPASAVGHLGMGTEVRFTLDAAPQHVIPANITCMGGAMRLPLDTVKTASSREKPVFRIRAKIPADFLRAHIKRVKTGESGMVYMRRNHQIPWPDPLEVRLPQ